MSAGGFAAYPGINRVANVYGRRSDGTAIPGGPYTTPQVVILAVMILVGVPIAIGLWFLSWAAATVFIAIWAFFLLALVLGTRDAFNVHGPRFTMFAARTHRRLFGTPQHSHGAPPRARTISGGN